MESAKEQKYYNLNEDIFIFCEKKFVNKLKVARIKCRDKLENKSSPEEKAVKVVRFISRQFIPLTFSSHNILYNHGHNILRLFDTLPNFLFTTSETKRDY